MEKKPVWTTSDPQQALLLQSTLESEGISTEVENLNSTKIGEFPIGAAIPIVLTVAETDFDRAIDVIKHSAAMGHPDVADVADMEKDLVSQSCACGKTLDVPAELKGSTVDCPFCGRSVVVA